MAFELQPLAWPKDALGEHMSAETLEYHHNKHHQSYVAKVNALVADTPLVHASLIDLVHAARLQEDELLFNNAAQIWNHNFFWLGLAPPEGIRPSGLLAELIRHDFGSLAKLIDRLAGEAANHFSNGWVWLVLDRDTLRVRSLHDGDTPLVHAGMIPLLAVDVWEHAYYIDHRNAREAYVRDLLEHLVDWNFVARNLDGLGRRRADQLPFSTTRATAKVAKADA